LVKNSNGERVQDASEGWSAGKILHYPDASGAPDSEGNTKARWDDPSICIAAERNTLANTVSRLSILRFDGSFAAAELTATHEWNLTGDLPVVGANLGLEAITWIPDAYLVEHSFAD
jgi:hypothetical protein